MLRDLDVKKLLDFDNEVEMTDAKFKKLTALFDDPDTKEYL